MPPRSPLFAVVPLVFATLAWVFGMGFFFNCRGIQFPSKLDIEDSVDIQAGIYGFRTKGVVTGNSGFWVVDTCRPYTDIEEEAGFEYEVDDFSERLKGIAISTTVIGCIAVFLSCLGVGVPLHPLIWKFMSICFLTCCILQGVGLKILNSSLCLDNPLMQYLEEEEPDVASLYPTECEKNMGWRLALTATVFWAIATIVALVVPSPDASDDTSPAPEKNEDAPPLEEQAPPVEAEGE